MKTFTVIQAGNVFQVEAEKVEVYPDKVFLVREDETVFMGPSAFTTVFNNDAMKSSPEDIYANSPWREESNG
jgi:hypothetical protein